MTVARFLTLEGAEGAGKSTHVNTIVDYLQAQGIDVMTTREPGGTVVSEAIRRVLLDPDLPAMHADTELLLMFAARNEHLQQTILPALDAGVWVICDRFTDASYAYQGYGRGLPLARIQQLEQWVQGELRPDYTLLFDVEVATGMQRVRARSVQSSQSVDRIEREQLRFFERVREGYLQRAATEPDRFRVIDAAPAIEQVAAAVRNTLQQIVMMDQPSVGRSS